MELNAEPTPGLTVAVSAAGINSLKASSGYYRDRKKNMGKKKKKEKNGSANSEHTPFCHSQKLLVRHLKQQQQELGLPKGQLHPCIPWRVTIVALHHNIDNC